MTTKTSKRPTHRVKYEIQGSDGKKVREIEVGAGWAHDGNGPLTIKLDVSPPTGAFLKIWEIKEKEAE